MNKKITKLVALIIIITLGAITLTGCGAKNETEGLAVYTIDEDMSGYTKCEDIEGIEFYYPSNYTKIEQSGQKMYIDPEIEGASVNLVSSDFPDGYTLESYVETSIEGVKSTMTIDGDIQTEYINLNGVKAAKLDYVASSDSQSMKLTQIALVKEGKAYVLTIGSAKEDAEAMQPKLEKVIKSLR